MPVTATGVVRWVVVPSPSWPLVFSPQHFTVPPWMSAHAKASPVATLVTLLRPETSVGS
ncbi:MAG: hypothetical protein U0359_02605 [Byssovorax sp.]